MKTPSSVTMDRRNRAKQLAYQLYTEYSEDDARKIIRLNREKASSDEGVKFWYCVKNTFEIQVNPPRHKPRKVSIAADQFNLSGSLVRGDGR